MTEKTTAKPLKDQILDADDIKIEPVEVPEWGVTVYVKTMTGTERDRFEDTSQGRSELGVRALLAVNCLCDKDGVLLFDTSDAEGLSKKSSRALDRIIVPASKLNGLRQKDIDDLVGK